MTWPNYGWWPMDVFAWLLFSVVVASLLYLVVTAGVCGVLWARERVTAWLGARRSEPPRQPLERMIDRSRARLPQPSVEDAERQLAILVRNGADPEVLIAARKTLRHAELYANPGGGVQWKRPRPAPTSIPGDGEPRE